MFKFILLLVVPLVYGNLLDGWEGPGNRITRPGPIITLNQGRIRGIIERYDGSETFMCYKGIPYAEPPIGKLRWKAPVPASGWSGTRDGSLYGANCPQLTTPIIGTRQPFVTNEDCLFLNVFTPDRFLMRNLPVFFHIHQGDFNSESGDPNLTGWEFIPEYGHAIYVTFNYRLDVLGHLNTEDEHATGNYALKDVLEALRWVNANIHSFGGDPNNVILMGHNSGGVIVQSLLYSQEAAGLFAKAVSLSGSIFQAYSFQPNPKEKAEALGNVLNLEWTSTEELVSKLRKFTAEQLLEASNTLKSTEMPNKFSPHAFVPSIDTEGTNEVNVIPMHPDILARNATINNVPLMIGFNSMHSMKNLNFPEGRDRFNEDPHLLIPDAWQIDRDSDEAYEIIDGFRRLYFEGSEVITEDMMMPWMEYCSDRENIFPVFKFADFHYQHQPVYFYRFSFSGAFSLHQQNHNLMDVNGATAEDDFMYLHRMNRQRNPVPINNHAYAVQDRYLRLMINFGRFGNPTPFRLDPLLQGTQWPQVTENMEFLDIGRNLVVDNHPFMERMVLWRDFDKRFNKF